MDSGLLEKLREGCSDLRRLKGWGNGRDLKQIWAQTLKNRARRVYDSKPLEKVIICADVQQAVNSMLQARVGKLAEGIPDGSDPLEPLDRLFRMEAVKKKLDRLRKTWVVARREGNSIPDLGHFVFSGPPGKSTKLFFYPVSICVLTPIVLFTTYRDGEDYSCTMPCIGIVWFKAKSFNQTRRNFWIGTDWSIHRPHKRKGYEILGRRKGSHSIH